MRKFGAGGKYIKKTDCLLLPVLVLMLTLAGCSRAEKDELSDEIRGLEDNTNQSSASDAEQVSAAIPERISYTIDGEGGNMVKVDAEVVSTGYGQMSIYKDERVDMDDAYLKELAETLFDGGEYEIVKPYFMCSRSELEDEAAYLEQWNEFYNKNGNTFPEWLWQCQDAVEYFSEYYDEENTVSNLTQGKLIYQTELSDEGETVWKQCILRGTIDGEPWELLCMNQNMYSRNISLELHQLDEVHQVYKLIDLEDEVQIRVRGDNTCDIEECEREACEMAEKLGFADMNIATAAHRVYADNEGNETLDGYRILMVRNTDGMQHMFGGDIGTATLDKGEYWTANQQCIAFDINAEGVTDIFINEIYRQGECMAEKAEFLNFNKADEMAQDYMQRMMDSLTYSDDIFFLRVNRVQLGYMTLHYEEGYTLVPVWAYFYADGDMWFGVNALDGSIVGIYGTQYYWIPVCNSSGIYYLYR